MFKKKNKTLPRRPNSQLKSNKKVFSYYSNNRNDISSTPLIKTNNRTVDSNILSRQNSGTRIITHIPTIIATILILTSIAFATTLDNNPKILIGNIAQGNSLVRSTNTYQTEISKILSKTVLNKSKLTINTSSVSAQIQANFPEIERATVTLPILGRRPIIGLDPSDPTLILSSLGRSYIIGRDGVAMIRVSDLVGKSQPTLPVIEDESGLGLEQGKQVLTKETVVFITSLIQQLKLKNITVDTIILPHIANELHIKISGKPYIVKYNLQSDSRQQTGTFLAVKDKLESQNIIPAEYIDVRINERAYYK